jgi:hypothetical protein
MIKLTSKIIFPLSVRKQQKTVKKIHSYELAIFFPFAIIFIHLFLSQLYTSSSVPLYLFAKLVSLLFNMKL